MSTVAFLRAINITNHFVKMEDLRAVLVNQGFENVQTYIQSGNVVFADPTISYAEAETLINRQLEARFGFAVETFLRSASELVALEQACPFEPSEIDPKAALYLTFVRHEPDAEAQARLAKHQNELDTFRITGRHVWWLRHKQVGESKFSGAKLERALKQAGTARNITTIRAMITKYGFTNA
ncbi:DUF1697 domain-containing protein [Herpetosiphon geysericola]|uniref:DUF1697 domain-containing protein n=1 Tax=Herpetosiphon geysericola TaxID=70996 RepID=A0A0P6Y0Z1_9CHLR|nr:DUF1697 domain-containing protein [Herpetosiphon geysericola]KPL85575.1 hypothetical protein SE18_18355 [Herpetosiphon geysericola]